MPNQQLSLVKHISIICFLFLNFHLHAQSGGLNNIATKILNTDYLDKSGNSLSEVKGSPFAEETWQPAFLYLNGGGRVFVNKAKLNNYTGELHYINENGTELAPLQNTVLRFDLLDFKDSSIVKKQYFYFSDPFKNNQFNFFEAHNDGPVKLLSRQEKFIFTENYDPLKGKTEQYFKTNTYYAILINSNLTKLNDLNREEILKALSSASKKYPIETKQKLKTIKEVAAFLNQLNQ